MFFYQKQLLFLINICFLIENDYFLNIGFLIERWSHFHNKYWCSFESVLIFFMNICLHKKMIRKLSIQVCKKMLTLKNIQIWIVKLAFVKLYYGFLYFLTKTKEKHRKTNGFWRKPKKTIEKPMKTNKTLQKLSKNKKKQKKPWIFERWSPPPDLFWNHCFFCFFLLFESFWKVSLVFIGFRMVFFTF